MWTYAYTVHRWCVKAVNYIYTITYTYTCPSHPSSPPSSSIAM